MSEELVVDNCSPTLARIKTGNLFSVKITRLLSHLKDPVRI